MAKLNFEYTENMYGSRVDVYHCSECNQTFIFRHGEPPYMGSCENCNSEFTEFEFNDQIGG